MEEYAREPCPWRIVDDCGGAFAMGAIGGTVFHSIKGFSIWPNCFVLFILNSPFFFLFFFCFFFVATYVLR